MRPNAMRLLAVLKCIGRWASYPAAATRAADRSGHTPMPTKLDTVLIVAWLGSGAMALENSGRVDLGARERVAQIRPMTCHVMQRPSEDLPAGLVTPGRGSQIDFESALADLDIRCEPS